MSDIDTHPLTIALSAAVPLHILAFQQQGRPLARDYRRARAFAQELGEHGDILLYRGKKEGETAALFNKLAKAIAVLSFCPGGVTLFGQKWESQ